MEETRHVKTQMLHCTGGGRREKEEGAVVWRDSTSLDLMGQDMTVLAGKEAVNLKKIYDR